VELGNRKPIVIGSEPTESTTGTLDLMAIAVKEHGVSWMSCAGTDLPSRLETLFNTDGSPTAPIAVCGFGPDAETVLFSAAEFGGITALALVGPTLSEEAVQLISEWPEVAVIALADPLRRAELSSAVNAYLASENPVSELLVGPLDTALVGSAASWLNKRLSSTTSVEEVMVLSSDGWELYGTLRLPESDESVPGILLLHSARSDRAVYARLERLLADRGFAVLNLDWRGRGQSIGRGTLFSLPDDERAESWRDGVAALTALAMRPEVDAGRLGILGAAQGAELAVRAAMRDKRVRAVVILTGYEPADQDEETYLTGGSSELFYVTSTDHRDRTRAMHNLYVQSNGKRTRFVEYPGSALGYQLFDVDPALESIIAEWFGEVLSA